MAQTTIDRHRMLLEMAEAIAPTWERRREFIERGATPVREWLVRELDAGPGQTVLEVAAGVGDTGFEVAGKLGAGGRLVSTDFSPKMVEAAQRRAAALGVTNAEFRVADGAATGLDDDSVDGVICRFGYMLMADPAAALAETRRVLRPGGRLTLAVWGAPERNPFFTAVAMLLVQRGALPPPDPTAPGPFTLSDPSRLQALLSDAGFGEVRVEEVPVTFEVPDTEEYLAVTADTAGPIALALRSLSTAEREELAGQLADAVGRFDTGTGYRIPGVALCAVAT